MTYRINYPVLAQIRNGSQRAEALEQEIAKCDYLCLTDCFANPELGGPLTLQWLDEEAKRDAPSGRMRKFRIRVLRDEWGNQPPDITSVERVITLPLITRDGKQLSSRVLNDMRRRGDFERRYIVRRKYDLDEKGCFEAGYEDAGWFLSTYGIHFDSKIALPTNGRRELSASPCRAPDGSMKYIWYWRYEEAPPWVYDELPVLGTKDKPQRGRPRSSVD